MSKRKFNGKVYQKQDTSSNRRSLLKIAERLRRKTQNGRRQNARVVKEGKKYSLYTRTVKK